MAFVSQIALPNLFLHDKKENNERKKEKNDQYSIDRSSWTAGFFFSCVRREFVDTLVFVSNDHFNTFVQISNDQKDVQTHSHRHTHTHDETLQPRTVCLHIHASRTHSLQQTQSERNA